MRHDCERRIQVVYDGVIVGDFIADMFVEELVIVENKAIQVLATTHEVQLVTYLSATGPSVGTEGPGGSRVLLSRHYLRSTTSAPLRVTSTA